MAGIIFFKSALYREVLEFYINRLGMKVWLQQKACTVLQHDNQLIGFCTGNAADTNGTVTFFYKTKSDVDKLFSCLQDIALHPPKENPDYHIYHFYATDPEGRSVEIQTFLHELKPFTNTESALRERRSIRKYTSETVSDALLHQVFELCRWSPTARNRQNYYYIVIKNRQILEQIVTIRGQAGLPVLAAPFAIAVCAEGEMHDRIVQDACIAAYHLLLAAHAHGLGTCWVTDMDKPEIKELLSVPAQDYIACLTPIGFPDEIKYIPERHQTAEFVRILE